MNFHFPTLCIAMIMPLGLPAFGQQTGTFGETLIISGQIEAGDEPIEFNIEDLKGLPVTEFDTSTLWTEGVHRFTGVALSDLMEAVSAHGDLINATAINDYSVEIPMSDAVPSGPIVAYHMDGAPLSVRQKGPFWIVYPYDSDHAYRSEVIYSRSIWQLSSLSVDE